jgi:osmotically-inducible protein OsmY
MNQSLVMDSDECWCSSTGRLKETSQERKKLPNVEVVQIKWKVGFDRKREEDRKFMIEALQTIGEIWWNGGGNLIGIANEPTDRAGKALAEARLTTKIKSKIALDDTIESSGIDVDTIGTVVTVTGSVATKAQHQRVVQLARETAGVTSVVDHVQVKGVR